MISIIIPVYNSAKYLERCLESVISQTYVNLEIIIVNDGSTDHSAEIIAEFSSRDRRIVAVHQKNQGVSAARNTGLERAKGNFIGFVDADDEVYPDMYEFLLGNLQKYGADISHCGFELVKSDGVVKFHDSGLVLLQNKEEAIKELLSGQRIEPGIWNKLFKNDLLKNVRFATDIKINEDLLFNIEAFSFSEKSIFEDIVRYKYHRNPVSASHSTQPEVVAQEIYEAARRIRLLLQDGVLRDSAEKFYVSKLLTSLKSLQKNHLFDSELAKTFRLELKQNKAQNLGLRVSVLKILLVDLPFFYSPFMYFYDRLFAQTQKWR